MTDASISVEEVQVRFHLSPSDRIITGLLFGRQYRVCGPLGALLCGLSLIPGLRDSNWALYPEGLLLLLSFLWLPFATAFRRPPMTLKATAEGLELVGATAQATFQWRAVRRIRAMAGYLVLDSAVGTVTIPRRALQQEQLTMLQNYFAASRHTNPPAEALPPSTVPDGSTLSIAHSPRRSDIFLALAWRPMNAAFVVLGFGVVAVSIRDAMIGSGPDYDPQSYWSFVPFGVIVMLVPIWLPLFRVFLGGGTRAVVLAGIDVNSDGFRVGNDVLSTWVSWDSYRSARRVRQVIVFRVKGSSHDTYLSTRGLTHAQLVALRTALSLHGLDPG